MKVADEVEVRVPIVALPIDEDDVYESTNLEFVAKNAVEEANGMVIPPFESMRNAVVVPPAVGIATTWNKFKFESDEVAETESTDSGDVVPMPTLCAPPAYIAS